MNKKTTGAWLVFQTGKLQRVDSQSDFESTFVAGKAGVLLSALASDSESQLPLDRVRALARASNINTITELPVLLSVLQEHRVVDLGTNEVAVLGVTTAATLQHTADIFESLHPSNRERAAIWINEATSDRPVTLRTLSEEVSDRFELPRTGASELLGSVESVGFVDSIIPDSSSRLLFNGNIFRRENAAKTAKVLDSLSSEERALLGELSARLESSACLPLTAAQNILGEALFSKVASIGLYDVSIVSNTSEQVAYVTKPGAFAKYGSSMEDDPFDLAKIFVSSLTYGMTRSPYSRGEIRMVEALLQALIRGESIGPVQAIGEDYKILEMKGVVKVFDGGKNGRYGKMMKLLKAEVGVLALEVITRADASEHSLENLPHAAVNMYRGPEQNREVTWRRTRDRSPSEVTGILLALRTGG